MPAESLDAIPSLIHTIREYGLNTKKSLGQHFLTDANLLDKIVSSAGETSNSTVVEIGPGPGGLTRSLLKKGVKKLIVIEKDKRCIPALHQLQYIYPEALEIIEKDAMTIKLSDIANGKKIKIISNLPYNIATELLMQWLNEIDHIESMILMFQKEVAERITSEPGRKSYGRLSVICQWLCECNKLFDISPRSFTPPPKVTSTVISIQAMSKALYPANKKSLEYVCKATFGQRRKTLRSSLKQITKYPEELLQRAAIQPKLRPEQLTIKQFCSLSAAYDDLAL